MRIKKIGEEVDTENWTEGGHRERREGEQEGEANRRSRKKRIGGQDGKVNGRERGQRE